MTEFLNYLFKLVVIGTFVFTFVLIKRFYSYKNPLIYLQKLSVFQGELLLLQKDIQV